MKNRKPIFAVNTEERVHDDSIKQGTGGSVDTYDPVHGLIIIIGKD